MKNIQTRLIFAINFKISLVFKIGKLAAVILSVATMLTLKKYTHLQRLKQ